MAFTVGNPILASELVAIKARVKAEMLRRNKVGSLAAYGGAAYDYTVVPAAGNPILPEHFNKIITPMNAMVNTGLSTVNSGDPIPSLEGLVNQLTAAEKYALASKTTNCRSSCSGLCVGTCYNACGGSCSTSCVGGCSGGCADACSDGCTASCGSSCNTHCSQKCTGYCDGTCSDECKGGCVYHCTGTCGGQVNRNDGYA